MIVGTWMAEAMQLKPVFPLQFGGETYAIYIGLIALSQIRDQLHRLRRIERIRR